MGEELNELDSEVVELFGERVRGWVRTWPLNQARSDLLAVAMRRVAGELEEGVFNDD